MCPPGHASSRDPFTGRHTGRPLRIRLKYQSTPKQRAGTEPRPYRSIAVPNGGPMYLRHGFRRPNFVPKFGASVMVIGPYGKKSKPHQPPESAAHSGAFAAWMGGNGWELRQRPSPRCPATPDNPSVMAFGHASSLYTREPLGTGDTDCRVASLLAMTVLILCHSEEAQRANVGIRPFYDGRGFGPPYLGHGLRQPNSVPKFGASVRSSAPTESPINHPSQQASRRAAKRPRPRPRGMGGNRRKDHPKRGTSAATAQAALSEAESAERAAGQIRSLPDDLRGQHGVQGSEVCERPRPCSRRGCVD